MYSGTAIRSVFGPFLIRFRTFWDSPRLGGENHLKNIYKGTSLLGDMACQEVVAHLHRPLAPKIIVPIEDPIERVE